MKKKSVLCNVCQKSFLEDEVISGYGIRKELETLILKDYPKWSDESFICLEDFNKYRRKYISHLVQEEHGKIERLEQDVINSLHNNDLLSINPEKVFDNKLTFGEKIADQVADFGGSWKFIILFFLVLMAWIAINSFILISHPFDPYPFILMNLILSCLAAIQAPIIMMSQNRQETKDRMRAENDYKINLKSEIEIRTLHEKIDHLLQDQWSRMVNIQEIQMDMLEELIHKKKNKTN